MDSLPGQIPAFAFRIGALERDIADLRQQLHLYVPAKENELQLNNIQESVEHIEQDVQWLKKKLEELNNKLMDQELAAQHRDAVQRESQAALQIRVLWGTISVIMTIMTSVLVAYITHMFR